MPIFNGGRIGSNNVPFTGTKSDDPNYSSVSLLLNGNGTNGSTTFTDSSNNSHTVTANGNAQISTAQSKFGGASMYFDGSGDYLEITDALNQFDLGGIDATLEFWTYISSSSGADAIVAKGGNTANWVLTDGFIYQVQYDNTNSQFRFNYNNGGGAGGVTRLFGGSQPINSWYHIAVVTTSSNNISLYVNGISVATDTNAISKPTTRTRFRVGTDLSNNDFNGYISNLRVVKGKALYTSNFAVPTRELEVTPETVLVACYDGENIFAEKTGKIIAAYGDRLSSPSPTATDSPIGITTFRP